MQMTLIHAKTVGTAFVTGLVVATTDASPIHDSALFAKIRKAIEKAKDDISHATTPSAVEAIASSATTGTGIVAINDANSAYNNSIKLMQMTLIHAKTVGTAFVAGLVVATTDASPTHDSELFAKIGKAIEKAKDDISHATTPSAVEAIASSAATGTGIVAINNANTAYNNSIGRGLKYFKNQAKNFVKTIRESIEEDSVLYTQSLFGAITAAVNHANSEIDKSDNVSRIHILASSPSAGTEIDKIQEAINAYVATLTISSFNIKYPGGIRGTQLRNLEAYYEDDTNTKFKSTFRIPAAVTTILD